MTMSINLTPQLEELVRAKVTSGLYNSASEVVREALRLMVHRDQIQQGQQSASLRQLRQDIEQGLQSESAGELDIEAIKRRGRGKLALAKRN